MSSENTTPDTTEYAIEVNGLGKCYQIYDKPSDRLKQMLMRGRKQYYKEFWALKDVSFKIKKGETVGIIGRNGSGKSTLLQMICGTLNPTGGEVKVNGRVAALLELGAGFNPEFSGVENVYMAASLYGLSKEDVDQRFDDIATFADIGDHIHQPVKTYSSGMYVRLGFAIVANIDAEILIIDEALAVGDVLFQQKCLRFLKHFENAGNTTLFVSHDHAMVNSLCSDVLYLKRTNAVETRCLFGQASDVIKIYLKDIYEQRLTSEGATNLKRASKALSTPLSLRLKSKFEVSVTEFNKNAHHIGTEDALIADAGFVDETENKVYEFLTSEIVTFQVVIQAYKQIEDVSLAIILKDRNGVFIYVDGTNGKLDDGNFNINKDNEVVVSFCFKFPILINGSYSLDISLTSGDDFENYSLCWVYDSIIVKVSSARNVVGISSFDEMKIGLINNSFVDLGV
jgi:lipopolysaccharide transport system ATP-binding protein